MKKLKRILALAGVVLLAGLYLATLIFALIDNPWAFNLFKLSLGFTIVLPILLYGILLMARVLGGKPDLPEETSHSSQIKEDRHD